ncbi:MAG TPA: amino-acid racemase [Thermoanaerobacterales bacterium]|nr:amino-acid racemase [Thermoanaerobacterales bacterium]
MNIHELSTPSFLVELDTLENNISEMAKICKENDVELWPMVKTHKSGMIAKMQYDAGVGGFLAGTIDEAGKLVDSGFKDIMLAYPVAGKENTKRVIDLAKKARIIAAFDGEDTAKELNNALTQANMDLEYLIIIDCGLHRFGVEPEFTGDLAKKLQQYGKLKYKGISTHPGQVYGASNMKEVEGVAGIEVEALKIAVKSLEEKGFSADIVATGSTPTARFAVKSGVVTVLRPGNYAFYDNIQMALGVVPEERCSLTVLATVISRPNKEMLIIDAGSKCFGLDKGAHGIALIKGFGYVKGHPELIITDLSEEVAKLKIEGNTTVKVGDKLEVIPNHACSSANMTSFLVGHRNGTIEKTIYIDARGGTLRKPPV